MIVTLGITRFNDNVFMFPKNGENQYTNKPDGGLWGSSLDINGDYISDWASFVFNNYYRTKHYCHGMMYELNPLARILRIETPQDYIDLLKEYGTYPNPKFVSNYNLDKLFIDWDAIAEKYDAVHISHRAFMFWRLPCDERIDDAVSQLGSEPADLYSYDCESWVICRPEAIDFSTIRRITVNKEGQIMFKEKYLAFNEIDIADMLNMRRESQEMGLTSMHDTIVLKDNTRVRYIDATVDQYIDYLTKYDYKMKRNDFDRMITAIRSLPNANEDTIEICNLLLGNRNYFKKLTFNGDGSYRTNRIYFDASAGQLIVMVSLHKYDKVAQDYIKTLSEAEALKWVFKHFDTVCFSGPYNCYTVEGFQKEIIDKRERELLDDYYDELWSSTDDMPLHE